MGAKFTFWRPKTNFPENCQRDGPQDGLRAIEIDLKPIVRRCTIPEVSAEWDDDHRARSGLRA